MAKTKTRPIDLTGIAEGVLVGVVVAITLVLIKKYFPQTQGY